MALDPVLHAAGHGAAAGRALCRPGDQRTHRVHLWRLLWMLWGKDGVEMYGMRLEWNRIDFSFALLLQDKVILH